MLSVYITFFLLLKHLLFPLISDSYSNRSEVISHYGVAF